MPDTFEDENDWSAAPAIATLGLVLPPWVDGRTPRYAFRLPKQTPSNNEIRELHFMAYRQLRKVWKNRVLARGLHGRRPKTPIETSALVVVRYCAGSLDWDNALGGLKPVQDCLVVKKAKVNPDGLGLIRDDNPINMPFPPYMQQRYAPSSEGYTDVYVFDISDFAGLPAPSHATVPPVEIEGG